MCLEIEHGSNHLLPDHLVDPRIYTHIHSNVLYNKLIDFTPADL